MVEAHLSHCTNIPLAFGVCEPHSQRPLLVRPMVLLVLAGALDMAVTRASDIFSPISLQCVWGLLQLLQLRAVTSRFSLFWIGCFFVSLCSFRTLFPVVLAPNPRVGRS